MARLSLHFRFSHPMQRLLTLFNFPLSPIFRFSANSPLIEVDQVGHAFDFLDAIRTAHRG